ncbi:unnamed protein product [Calypogeia fissa]
MFMESSSFRPSKVNLKSFIAPLPRLGSIDALELSALKSGDRGESSMDCPKCNERLLCDNCCRYYKGDPVFKAPGCEKCKKRYEKEIEDAKTELATLRLALRDKFSKQIMAYEDTQRKLTDRLLFMKLQDPDPSNEVFKGDVSLVVHGVDFIHAHRFVLAGKSPVFYRMFDVSMLEKQTGLIPIDDATLPVMRAVINYCYTAEISFTEEVPPEEVLQVAHKYEITHLRDVCGDELCQRIDETNLADMLRLSKKFEAKTLQEAAAKYFKEHFDTVFSTVLDNL